MKEIGVSELVVRCHKCGWIFKKLGFYTKESGYKKVAFYEATELRDKHSEECDEVL